MAFAFRGPQKRIYIPGAVYFVTVVTDHRFPFFKEWIFGDVFVEELRLCKRLKGFKLYGWVLCFDHCHLLIEPAGKWSYSEIVQFLKRHSSRNTNIIMSHATEGAIGQSRLREEYTDFQQTISHMTFFVSRARIQFLLKYHNRNPFPTFRWQKSFHDHYCRNEKDFRNHLAYIAGNPDKHDLPDLWPYVFTNPKYQDLIDPV